jgi:hypothetical protein
LGKIVNSLKEIIKKKTSALTMAWYSRRWYLLFSGSQMRLKVLMVVKEVPDKIRS